MSILDPFKRVERLKKAKPRRASESNDRIPPGQYLTEKFPVLSAGPTPVVDLDTWQLRLFGLVEKEVSLNWADFKQLPRTIVKDDIHCVTRWSKLDTVWEGVLFSDLLKLVSLKDEAAFVVQHAYGGYTTNLPLEELLRPNVILADIYDGQPLEPDHGGPLRLVVPDLYFWKSTKWLNGLDFVAEDQPGFWERAGYHNFGDPWKEERFNNQ